MIQAALKARILFSPFDPTTAEFLAFVQSAEHHIDLVIFGFHLPALTDLLIEKHRSGVKVSMLLDHSQSVGKAEHGEVQRLIDAGVPFLIGTSTMHGQIMHSKFTVIDGAKVEHGSWNYSTSAGFQSNTMIFHEDEAIARAFLDHHDKLRAFILLHEHAMQPDGEVPAGESLETDLDLSDAATARKVIETKATHGRAFIHRGHSRGSRVAPSVMPDALGALAPVSLPFLNIPPFMQAQMRATLGGPHAGF